MAAGNDLGPVFTLPSLIDDRKTSVVSCSLSQRQHHEQRGGWKNKHDFFFSIMGSVVGLGAIWRFPYLVYKHGGGAFMVIFIISMTLLGIPIFFYELMMGQYLGLSQVCVYGQVAPILKGIGYCIATIVFYLCTYYAVILGWIIYYFFASFVAIPDLPWNGCDHEWNTEHCIDVLQKNHTHYGSGTIPAVEEYWNNHVLGITDGLEDMGSVRWELVGALLASWIVIYLIVWKGLHGSGKVIWFTAIFPYIILLILFVRAVTLDGAAQGLLFYVNPVWSKLLDPVAWVDGGTQVAFSYSCGTGALYALGSYNDYSFNLYKPVMIVAVVSTLTGLFAGCVTFSVLGFLAHETNKTVADVIEQGPGLTFVAYPQCVSLMKGAPFWAILFFFMMLLIGINSQFASVEGFILAIADDWRKYLSDTKRRFWFNMITCIVFFLLGLPMVTGGGPYLFQLIDSFGVSGLPVLWTLTFENIAFNYVWGTDKLTRAMKEMTGVNLFIGWKICWRYICPLFMTFLFFFNIVKNEPATYGGTYVYPWWGQMIGWLIGTTVMMWVPLYAVVFMYNSEGTFMQRLKKGLTPNVKKRPDRSSL